MATTSASAAPQVLNSTERPAILSMYAKGTANAKGKTIAPKTRRLALPGSWANNPAASDVRLGLRATAAPSAIVAQVSASAETGIRSDEFNSAALDSSVWTFVDPIGNSSLTMTGSQARIAVPAGSRHDLWANANEVPRLRQSAPNANFEVEVKFDSAVSVGYQLQGVVVEQDAQNLLRLEVFHDGGTTHLFAAAISGGSASVQHYSDVAGGAPTYLRVKRTGNTWTLSHSRNGTAWTSATFSYPLTVTSIGPYAGNSGGSPPAFTGQIDYFREITPVVDAVPPVVSAVSAATSASAASITWTTNEAADSRVAYGPTTAYENGVVLKTARVTNHGVTLLGLACATTYHYRASSRDAAGNEGASPDGTFTTAPCPTAIRSDEFNAASLDTSVWAFSDPLGDSGLALTGSQAALSLPAGSRHDLWTATDEVPKLLRRAEHELRGGGEVGHGRHRGLPPPGHRGRPGRGRHAAHRDPQRRRRDAAVHRPDRRRRGVDGALRELRRSTPPVYFRLKRQGSTWTLRTSSDGELDALGHVHRGAQRHGDRALRRQLRQQPAGLHEPHRLLPGRAAGRDAAGHLGADGAAHRRRGERHLDDRRAVRLGGPLRAHHRLRGGRGRPASAPARRCSCCTASRARPLPLPGPLARRRRQRAASTDRTFTTGACPAFLQSDEFNGTSLDTSKWTHVDPLGDTGVAVSGGHAR